MDIDCYNGTPATKRPFNGNITSKIVELMEKDLEFYEKVSMFFLVCENENIEHAYQTLKFGLKKLDKTEDMSTFHPLSKWAKKRELKGDVKWQEKLMEALCIIKNYEVIKKLGCDIEEMRNRFLPHNPYVSVEVDLMRKSLYFVMESLRIEQSRKLIKLSVTDGKCKGLKLRTYSAKYLEISLLHWNSQKYINFTNSARDLSKLSRHLKILKEDWLSNYLRFIEKRIVQNLGCSEPVLQNSSQNSDYSESGSQYCSQNSESSESGSKVPTSSDMSEGLPHSKLNYYPLQGTGKTPSSYKMNLQNVGVCLIINQKRFWEDCSPDVEPLHPSQKLRLGTDIDRDRLRDTFEALGFIVGCFSNLTSRKILKTVQSVSNSVKPEHSCFVLCILSHGKENAVYGSNSVPVNIRKIEILLNARNCHNLVGKPKILIIQACQGTPLQNACESDVITDVTTDGPNNSESQQCIVAPEISDEIIFWSTIPGYASFRDPVEGSWFIKALTNELILQKKEDDICKIFIKVNANVANRYTTLTRKAMQPAFSTSFTKLLYFTFTSHNKLCFIKQMLKRQLFYHLLKEFFLWLYRNCDSNSQLKLIQYCYR